MVEFLESVAPGEAVQVVDLLERRNALLGSLMYLHTPDIQLHCASCGGARNFACMDAEITIVQPCSVFRTYQCRNCGTDPKLFALSIEYTPNDVHPDAVACKVGEIPIFTTSSAANYSSVRNLSVDDLHPEIKKACLPLCQNGHLAEGVEKSFKIVRDRLRKLTGYETGSDAFGKAGLRIKGAAEPHVADDFNEGVKFLTMAIDRFRNEKAHVVDGNVRDEVRAYEYLRLSSLAMHLPENGYTEQHEFLECSVPAHLSDAVLERGRPASAEAFRYGIEIPKQFLVISLYLTIVFTSCFYRPFRLS